MIALNATALAPVQAAGPPAAAARPADAETGTSFTDVLSALNPLQYLPVVGTIYRAVTGDRVAEPMRIMGSIVASGLMGGPLGLALSAGSALLQHLTGIDVDHVTHEVLEAVGLVDGEPAPATAMAAAPEAGGAAPDAGAVRTAMAAYGQTLYTYGAGAGHA